MDREDLADVGRLRANVSTERYQPHWGMGTISGRPLDVTGAGWTIPEGGPGVVSVIHRGATGVGAAFSFAEPVGRNWHPAETGGAAPLVARPAGA